MSGGIKHDQGKPDLTYESLETQVLLARVREFGAKKYSRDQWKNGFSMLRSLAAAKRHIEKFLSGQTYDEESGLLELGHAMANLEHAIYDFVHRPENDDRPFKDVTVSFKKIDERIMAPSRQSLYLNPETNQVEIKEEK
jgi:hypothetical protein